MTHVRFNCPHCNQRLKVLDELLRKDTIKCPHCKQQFKTAQVAGPSPVPPPVPPGSQPPQDAVPGQAVSDQDFLESIVQDGQTRSDSGSTRLTSDTIRQNFAQAIALVLSDARDSFAVLMRHPLRLSFYTLVFLLLAIGSIFGLVTVVLLPMFLMGYLTVIKQVINREPVNLAAFVAFMRHGWNSLWQLLMLFASFLVTISVIVAPVLLVCAVLYFGGKTLALAYSAIPFATADSSQTSQRAAAPRLARPAPSQEENSFLRKLSEFVSEFFAQIMLLIWIGLAFWPLSSALILFFYLTFDVSTRRPADAKAFDLVYESFSEMLVVAGQRWKEVLLSGLFVSTALAVLAFLMGVATMLLVRGNCFRTWVWLMTVGLPIAGFGFVVYVILFMATTCLRLKETRAPASAGSVPLR
jgi:hypothetical protein